MPTLKTVPFAYLFLCYVSGIILESYFNVESFEDYIYAALLFAFLLLFIYWKNSKAFLLSMAVFLLLSGLVTSLYKYNKEGIINRILQEKISGTFSAQVIKVDTSSNYIKLSAVLNKNKHLPTHLWNCKGILYQRKGSGPIPALASNIKFTGRLDTFEAPKNPLEFDYRSFMHNKGFFYSTFIQSIDILPDTLYVNKAFLLSFQAYSATISRALEESMENEESLSLIKAIFLGEKSSMDKETIIAFSNTGARHILTVSGMHVGLLLMIIMVIFKALPEHKAWMKFAKLLLPLCIIWFYALLTGAQPAVLRATFMLSVLLFGKWLKGNYFSLNALFFSAFVLLLYDPGLLYNLSFQFSYAALLSIIFFYPFVVSLLKLKNPIIRYVYQLLSISIAAQVFIMPLAAFYFHKIPLLFMLSSVIATPVAFAIMLLSVVLIADYFSFSMLTDVWGFLLDHIASSFLKAIRYLDDLPRGTLENIHLDHFQLILLLFLALALYFFIEKKRPVFAFLSLTALLLFQLYSFYTNEMQNEKEELCIYKMKHNTVIDFFSGRICYTWNKNQAYDVTSGFENEAYRLSKKPRRIEAVRKASIHNEKDGLEVINFNDYTIGVVKGRGKALNDCMRIDYLLVLTDDLKTIDAHMENLDIGMLILPMELKYSVTKKLLKNYPERCYSIRFEGPFFIQAKSISS